MNLPFQQHWLESAIGSDREAAKIAQSIISRPEFQGIILDSIKFAETDSTVDKTRVIAEHIVVLLSSS